MAVPAGLMEKALKGMEALYRRGIRYPISFAGAEQDLTSSFPMSYGALGALDTIRGRDGRLLLGVTGGIATGKSTVSAMLQDLGAHLIDFDVLARRVVEPGTPAWKEIVAYFGRQVLREDDSLDRKVLSEIVFRDFEKRKKLESFTHPRIHEEFVKEVREIASTHPKPIIQVGIPLLIELNLQYLFHKILVVYLPQELQIDRLAKRDGITRDQAANILKAQIPIDEKIGYADFVIYNNGPIEETKIQVMDLWKKLLDFQNTI
jgi:dephospho-CoA kinase